MIIAVDLDSVLNNLSLYWLEAYNKEYQDNFTPEQITEWDWDKIIPIGLKIYDYLNRPGFFTDCPPILPAIEAVRKLHADPTNTVLIVTACDNAPHVYAEKAAWIEKHLPFLPKKNKLIGGNWKHLLNANVLIDDAPANCLSFRKAHPSACIVTMKYPYNVPGRSACNFVATGYTDFAKTWSEIYDYIEWWKNSW